MPDPRVIEKILTAAKTVSTAIIPALGNAVGLEADIFLATGDGSIYGRYGDGKTFDTPPDTTKRVLIFGIFLERFSGDASIDTYTDEEIYIVEPDSTVWPIGTRIRIKLESTYTLDFIVKSIMGHQGLDSMVFKKYRLVPSEMEPTEAQGT